MAKMTRMDLLTEQVQEQLSEFRKAITVYEAKGNKEQAYYCKGRRDAYECVITAILNLEMDFQGQKDIFIMKQTRAAERKG